MTKPSYTVHNTPRGNRCVYIIRDESGTEVAWAPTGDDARYYIKHTLKGRDLTDWDWHRLLGSIVRAPLDVPL